mgnify:CR=1 FL=1
MPIPSKCPSCGGELEVTKLGCRSCKAVIEGSFSPCPVCRLSADDLEIFDLFMEARGNLKEVQRALGLSYPTVRNRVETMFEHYDERSEHAATPMDVLEKLKAGEIDVNEAEKLLKGKPQ